VEGEEKLSSLKAPRNGQTFGKRVVEEKAIKKTGNISTKEKLALEVFYALSEMGGGGRKWKGWGGHVGGGPTKGAGRGGGAWGGFFGGGKPWSVWSEGGEWKSSEGR